MFEHLIVERRGAVTSVAVNRPAVLNALSARTLEELEALMAELAGDDSVRAVVVTGTGRKAFVAGADINELAVATPVAGRALAHRGQRVFDRIEQLGKPVVAAINGYALGGGCELALACTFRIAAETARLGLPEITLGLIPGYGGTQRLARLIGRARALDLILTGRHVAADEALQLGLVHRVVPADELAGAAFEVAEQLAAKAPVAVRVALDAVLVGAEMSFADGCRYESALFGLLMSTGDMREGTRAFLEKRAPIFKGQ